MKRRTLITATSAALATLGAPMLRAQTLPAGSIRIVVGFPPGGGTDALARVVGQKLAVMWNQPVVIETKAGAAGVIAADFVAKQPADGNTLLMAHINSHAIAPGLQPKLTYNVERDFTPIVMVGVTPNLLVCNQEQSAKTVKDIVERCKKNPGKVSFASAGGGSAQHLALEAFKLRAGIFALHVPYRGSGPAIVDVIAGQVDYCFETMTSATPHVKGGKLVPIAQTRPTRSRAFPNVPTMHEEGFPGFDATTWYGLVGPGNLPPAYVKRMNEDVNTVLAMPDVVEKLAQYGAEDGGGSADKFRAFIQSEQVKWAKVVKDAGIKADS
jgi:tripartite-type tricarboxylate transporter receptor subunit TctC